MRLAKKFALPISFDQIVQYHFTGKCPLQLIKAWVTLEDRQSYSWFDLTILDLAGVDIPSAVERAKQTQTIEIGPIEFDKVPIRLSSLFILKLRLVSVLVPNLTNDIQRVLEQEQKKVAREWKEKDELKLKIYLRKQIFTTEFWETKLKVDLVKQNFEIRLRDAE